MQTHVSAQCNTVQHTATHCNMHFNALQHTSRKQYKRNTNLQWRQKTTMGVIHTCLCCHVAFMKQREMKATWQLMCTGLWYRHIFHAPSSFPSSHLCHLHMSLMWRCLSYASVTHVHTSHWCAYIYIAHMSLICMSHSCAYISNVYASLTLTRLSSSPLDLSCIFTCLCPWCLSHLHVSLIFMCVVMSRRRNSACLHCRLWRRERCLSECNLCLVTWTRERCLSHSNLCLVSISLSLVYRHVVCTWRHTSDVTIHKRRHDTHDLVYSHVDTAPCVVMSPSFRVVSCRHGGALFRREERWRWERHIKMRGLYLDEKRDVFNVM